MSDRNKAQTEVQLTFTDLEKAKAVEITAQAAVNRAQATVNATDVQLTALADGRVALDAQAGNTDPDNDDAIRWIETERSVLDVKRIALEGRRQREQEQLVKARTDLDDARVKLSQVQREHDAAQEKHDRALEAAEEARLVAAGDPGAVARKAASDRAAAVRDEHLRIIRANSSFGVGGPAEVSVEAEKIRTRLSNKEPLAPNEVGWGYGTAGAGRNTSPTGIGTSGSVDGGTSPQWNPYANEE